MKKMFKLAILLVTVVAFASCKKEKLDYVQHEQTITFKNPKNYEFIDLFDKEGYTSDAVVLSYIFPQNGTGWYQFPYKEGDIDFTVQYHDGFVVVHADGPSTWDIYPFSGDYTCKVKFVFFSKTKAKQLENQKIDLSKLTYEDALKLK